MPILSGQPGRPPPPPPPPPPGSPGPRRDWQFILGPRTGGWVSPLSQATNRSITWRLTDVHDAAFTVNANAGLDAGLDPLITDLHVLFAGKPVYRGRLGLGAPVSDVISATNGHLTTFTAQSYRSILERRIFYGNTPRVFTGLDMAALVMAIVNLTQNEAGGELGITPGVGGTGIGFSVNRKTIQGGDVIAELIDELAGTNQGGFEWDITPQDQQQLTLDIWAPFRGHDNGVFLQFGDGLTSGEWTRDFDSSTYANSLRLTGGTPTSGTAPAPVEITLSDIATRPEGRWDAVLSSTILDTNNLAAYGELQLNAMALATPSYTIPLRPDAWGGPSHIWLGDVVHVALGSGRFAGTLERLRVLEIAANITQDMTQVTLTLGQPAFNLRRQLKRLARELRHARQHRHAGRDSNPIYEITGPSGGL